MTHLVCQSKHVLAFSRRASVLVLLTIFLAILLTQNAPAQSSIGPAPLRTSTIQMVGTAGNDVIVIDDSLQTIRINSVYFSGSGRAHCLFDSNRVIFETPTATEARTRQPLRIRRPSILYCRQATGISISNNLVGTGKQS